MGNILYYLLGVSLLGMGYSFWKYYQLTQLEAGTANSTQLAGTIKKGVMRYIQSEYKILLLFVISVGLLLFFKGQSESSSNWQLSISYLVGAGISGLAGYLGVYISTLANVMTSNESRVSFAKGFESSTSGSAAIGLTNASLLTFGLIALLLLDKVTGKTWDSTTTLNVLAGFALGASSVSLFSKYGGSLFAKSAEIADNQIQNTEAGIKPNSLHNPTSTASDIGQNISNVAGTGADIFESFAATLIATMILGISFLSSESVIEKLAMGPVLVPLAIAAVGILASAGAIFVLKAIDSRDAKKMLAITEGVAAVVLVLAALFVTKFLLPVEWDVVKETETQKITTTYYSLGIFWCCFFGIAASVMIGKISPLFLGSKSKSIQISANQTAKGTDSGILVGLQNGFISIGLPIALLISVSILSYYYAGYYGLGMAAVGMLANIGFYNTLAAFAPITDNSNTIAIKSVLSDETIANTNELKKTGLQTLANSRNFMIVASSLSSITLLSAFIVHSGIELVNLSKPLVITGILLGAVLPFILSSTVLSSIIRIAKKMITETKRQFTEIPALSEAKAILDKYRGDLTYATEGEKEIVFGSVDDVDNNQLVEISAYTTVWQTIVPGGVVILLTAILGYFTGIEILAGFLTGLVSGGILLSLFMANSGTTLESTKLAFEEGVNVNGESQGTSSAGYQSTLITDKAGKPIKDSVAPSIMVILKLALITALIISSALIQRELSKNGLHIQNLDKHQIQIQKEIQKAGTNNFIM
jgi:K(+)-stimulated pyrophosphate-energized sodium pump